MCVIIILCVFLRLDSHALASVAENGHQDVLQFVNLHEGFRCDASILAAAAKGNRISLLQWLLDIFYVGTGLMPTDACICAGAAAGGNLDMLKSLREIGCMCDSTSYVAAARGGHLEIMKYLHASGIACTRDCYLPAAAEGHIHVLNWLLSISHPWQRYILNFAAADGHLEVCKWAVGTGNHLEMTDVCRLAAQSGCLEVLKWAHDVGAPWRNALDTAAEHKQWLVLEWTIENCTENELKLTRHLEHLLILAKRWRLLALAAAKGLPLKDKH